MRPDDSAGISRRDFLKVLGVASLGLVVSGCESDEILPSTTAATTTLAPATTTVTTALTTTSSVQPHLPDVASLIPMPSIDGERYTARVPDTLDLQQRAEHVLRTMTSCVDPKADYAPYDNMYLWRNPPVMRGTTMFNGKYMEATSLLRLLTGSDVNENVDRTWRRLFLGAVSDYPWWGIDGGRLLAWLGNNYRMEKDARWRELGTEALDRLSRGMVHKDDYSYMAADRIDRWTEASTGEMPTGWYATWAGWVLQGLTSLYVSTDDAQALELAARVARYLKDHALVFDADGHFLARHPSDNGPALHFHHNANALEGIAAFALATGNSEYASFAKRGYEWARSVGSSLVGFFPEYIKDWPDSRPYIDCETCCTADMIQVGMTLSQLSQDDYWDDVDRYVRNQFVEMQLLEGSWIDDMVAESPPTPVEASEDADRVSSRIMGSFSSWARANDWYIEGQPGTTFCCIGNGGRSLYYVWEKMLAFKNGALTVNLLFNRASQWADINSYVPYEGRVDVSVKVPCNLEIHIPEWAKPGEVSASVNGQPITLAFRGRYAVLGRVARGGLATVTFPISERKVDTVIGDLPYKLIIKGNDVVSIDPPGRWYPFYQRSRYRGDQTLWVERERFVPVAGQGDVSA